MVTGEALALVPVAVSPAMAAVTVEVYVYVNVDVYVEVDAESGIVLQFQYYPVESAACHMFGSRKHEYFRAVIS